MHGPPRSQRGAAALGVTVLLFFAMLLAVAAVDRNLIFEHRASVNQYHATQAFEAAEAGLEWALARLADGRGIDAACAPTADAVAVSFRAGRLAWSAATGRITPVTWNDAGTAVPLQASCVRSADGWSCSCPTAAHPTLVAPDVGVAPAFSVHFEPLARAGIVRAVAVGCTSFGGPCADGAGRTDATARVEATFALLPGLRSAPAAPLTVRGTVDADAAPFGAHNAEPGAALAIHAGGAVHAALARLEGPPGAPASERVAANDASLAGATPARAFASLFGLDETAWSQRAGVRHVRCPTIGDCRDVVLAALAAQRDPTLVHVDGDLVLDGPVDIGDVARPALLVVSGTAHLRGAVRITGVLQAADVEWAAGVAPGLVRGALVSAGDYRGDGAPDFLYDAAVLARLRGWSGSFVRVPGSWKDF